MMPILKRNEIAVVYYYRILIKNGDIKKGITFSAIETLTTVISFSCRTRTLILSQ